MLQDWGCFCEICSSWVLWVKSSVFKSEWRKSAKVQNFSNIIWILIMDHIQIHFAELYWFHRSQEKTKDYLWWLWSVTVSPLSPYMQILEYHLNTNHSTAFQILSNSLSTNLHTIWQHTIGNYWKHHQINKQLIN